MPNGRSSAEERAADGARPSRPLTNATSFTRTPYSSSNNAREAILIAEFTDDEEDNSHSYDPNEIRSIARNVGEDVVRTGEASRLRRRGAVHGRRPQLPYVTLVCGTPLPWRFKFNQPDDFQHTRPSSVRSLMHRYESLKTRPSSSSSSASQNLSLEFPSTGCRTILTNRAYVSPTHHVYSAQVATGSVRRVDRSYLDAEQKSILVEVLMNSWGQLDWQGLACSNCGNIVGFRYAPPVFDEQGKLVLDDTGPAGYTPKERFAFFASAVTSSKPYDFVTQRHYSYPYHWRYLEPLTTTPIVSPDSRSSLGPRTQHSLDTLSNPQGVRQYRHRHHPISASQDQRNSVSFPIANSDEVDLQSQREDPLPSWSFRSSSPLSSDELFPHEEDEVGSNNFEHQSNGILWVAWPSNPTFAQNDEDHTMGEHSLTEAVSLQNLTQTQDGGVRDQRGQLSPWQQAMALQPRPIDHSGADAVQTHDSNGETIVNSEVIDASTDTLQNQHALNVLPVSDEHELLGSSTTNAVTEAQASSDHHAEYTWANSPSASSQQQPLHLPDVEISDPFRTDGSQAYQESERVHDSMAQSESATVGVLRQEAAIDPPVELDTTIQSSNTLELFSVVPSTAMLPTPLPIAYESPATVVDVEASNETTGEVESVGILIEVASPPSDATSSFGSAVVVPTLFSSSTDSGLTQDGVQSLATPTDQSSQLTGPGPLELSTSSATNATPPDVQHIFSNDASDSAEGLDAAVTTTEDPDSNYEGPLPSSSYHHYTPPLPHLSTQDLAPSLPTSPSHTAFSLGPPLSPDPASLLTLLESSEGGLISAEPGVSPEHVDTDTEDTAPSQSLNRSIEVSVPSDQNVEMSQSYPEQASSTEHGHSYSSENRTAVSLVSRPQSPVPSSPSSSRRIIIAAPVSHPQPLPANFPILHETVALGTPSVSRPFPRHTLRRSSSSQHRSSSRRSWRTPRELDGSPVSLNNDGDDDIDDSVSRPQSRSGRETTSISRNESRSTRGTQLSPSVSRRTRGHSRTRRRRLSSSSRRDPLMSSASGPTLHALSSDLIRFPNRLQSQFRTGIDSLYRQSNLANASPELIRRGSLPNIQRPRLGSLIRRDSLPVLPARRPPLSDLTATFRAQHQLLPAARSSSSAASRARESPATIEDHNPVLNRRHWGERLVFDVDSPRGNEQDADTRNSRESSSEQENEPLIDPEDALTPRPRRHTTMPVFIPSPPSDSESELEDNVQPNERLSFSRGPTLVPRMPWEWCWQDRQQVPLENGLQIEVHATQITGEIEDKEE